MRGGQLRPALLVLCALLWLWFARDVSARAATGLGGRLLGGALTPALEGAFVAFLVALGLHGLRRHGMQTSGLREEFAGFAFVEELTRRRNCHLFFLNSHSSSLASWGEGFDYP